MARRKFKSNEPESQGSFYYKVVIVALLTLVTFDKFGTTQSTTSTQLEALFDPKTTQSEVIKHDASPAVAIDKSKLHPECFTIPNIRPSGVFFADRENKVINLPSIDKVEPPFRIGSVFKSGNLHMSGDVAHFLLIKEYFDTKYQIQQYNSDSSKSTKYLALDVGANQGFFTYFLAATGLRVHAFEIDATNFLSLQQGALYNTKEIADRVFLYPMGLSDTVGRMGSQGGNYEGFLRKENAGPILSSTLDCFCQHTQLLQQLPPNPQGGGKYVIPFVKIDVEGFEIAVLKGVHNSLYHPSVTIGSLLMEVGPKRWTRASISLEDGIEEMKLLASQFANNFVALRTPAVGHHEGCPLALAAQLKMSSPEREILGVQLYKVANDELKILLTEMAQKDFDCNFWYTN